MDATGDVVVAWQEYAAYISNSTRQRFEGIDAQRYQGETAANADVAVTGVSSDSTVTPGSSFSVSFEVVNRTAPTFETTDAYLNSFIGAVSNPTITVTLGQAATIPAGGLDWSCSGSQTTSFTCTYVGVVAAGQYSSPLIVGLVAPHTPGTISYDATVVGSSEPAFTGSVAVANPPGGSSGGGGGGFGWIELLGLASLSFLRRFGRKSAA
jgi:hypothetical protein